MTPPSKSASDDESETAFVARATDAIARTKSSSNGVSAEVVIANLTARIDAARSREIAFRSAENGPKVDRPSHG